MTAAPPVMQAETDDAFKTLEGIAVSMESGFPLADGKGRLANYRRQARRMRTALDAIRAELDFHDPPMVGADPEPEAPAWPA